MASRPSCGSPAAVAAGQLGQQVLDPVADGEGRHAHPFEDRKGDGVVLAEEGGQQMAQERPRGCCAAWPSTAAAGNASWVLAVQRLGSSATVTVSFC